MKTIACADESFMARREQREKCNIIITFKKYKIYKAHSIGGRNY